jgi:hypothetical protein
MLVIGLSYLAFVGNFAYIAKTDTYINLAWRSRENIQLELQKELYRCFTPLKHNNLPALLLHSSIITIKNFFRYLVAEHGHKFGNVYGDIVMTSLTDDKDVITQCTRNLSHSTSQQRAESAHGHICEDASEGWCFKFMPEEVARARHGSVYKPERNKNHLP